MFHMPTVVNLPGQTLGSIFTNTVIMPDYQREFAWGSKTLSNLLDSLNQHLINHDQILPAVPDPFYIGNMITVNAAGRIPIVDGQQRLTSIQLLAALIRDYAISREQYDGAYTIDENFVWKRDANNYSNGKMRVLPRNSGPGNLNPRESLLWISSLEFEFPTELEVLSVTPTPGAGTSDVQVQLYGGGAFNAPWFLGVGLKIEFEDGILELTSPVPQGALGATLRGDIIAKPGPGAVLPPSINIGDRAKLKIGKKNGAPPPNDKRTRVWKAWARLSDVVNERLNEWYPRGAAALPPAPHLATLDQYLNQFEALLTNSTVSVSQFALAGPAMQHFLTVNDFALRENLNALDMLRATVQKIIDSPNNPPLAAAPNRVANRTISDAFRDLENAIWTNVGKDPSYSNKFFVRFLLSRGIRDDDGDRYSVENCFSGISENFIIAHNANGRWNKSMISENLRMMVDHATYMRKADADWSVAVAGHNLDEEFYLRVLRDAKFEQWIPVYMAGAYRMNRNLGLPLGTSNITTAEYEIEMKRLLMSLTYVDVAGRILGKASTLNSCAGNAVWGRINNWITPLVTLTDTSNDVDLTAALDAIRDDINLWFSPANLDITYDLAGAPGTVDPRLLVPTFTMSNSDAKTIMQLLEWNWGAHRGAVSALTYFLPQNTIARLRWEVEHIQPKSPAAAVAAGFPWGGYGARTRVAWDENSNRLGNRLFLIQRQNRHLSNNEFSWKKEQPRCAATIVGGGVCGGNYHYGTIRANKANVQQWWAIFNRKRIWTTARITEWERHILTELVRVLPRPT